jgi:hypothetical protein
MSSGEATRSVTMLGQRGAEDDSAFLCWRIGLQKNIGTMLLFPGFPEVHDLYSFSS